jgi:uncharacterized membrane protein
MTATARYPILRRAITAPGGGRRLSRALRLRRASLGGAVRRALATILLAGATCLAQCHLAAASGLQPKRLAIVVKAPSEVRASAPRAPQSGSRAVAARLKDLGYGFLQLQDGQCNATDREASELESSQLEGALDCIEAVAGLAEIIVFYYAGPISTENGVNYIGSSVAPAGQGIVLADVLQRAATKASFVSVIIIDANAPSPEAGGRARQHYARTATPGTRRILAYSAPVGETSEPETRGIGGYTFRLLGALDREIGKLRRSEPLTDLRDLLRARDLVTSKAWPGRTSEVLVEGLGAEPITLVDGRSSARPAVRLPPEAATIQASSCGVAYRHVARGATCPAVFEFQKRCRDPAHATLANMALRLRCADELLEQKYKAMQESFARTEQQNNCAAFTRFIEVHATEFELADAPEMEKANALRARLCEQEAREKEIAVLETGLRGVLGENDCAALRRFERQNGARLDGGQSDRLTAASKRRCEQEERATATLRTCLEQSESTGNFCGAAACFSAFRVVLPQDGYFASHRAESQRQEKICREHSAMRSCFAGDECGGERCSLPLRLTVGASPLLTHIQRTEQEAARRCSAKLERKRQEELEAERARQRRIEEVRAQMRRDETYRLRLCNRSRFSKIWVALAYYDYDERDWVVEGWWDVGRGDCDYIGDRFKRGKLYFYAYTSASRGAWSGDFGLCVNTVRFRRVGNNKGVVCPSERHRKFRIREVTGSEYDLGFDD